MNDALLARILSPPTAAREHAGATMRRPTGTLARVTTLHDALAVRSRAHVRGAAPPGDGARNSAAVLGALAGRAAELRAQLRTLGVSPPSAARGAVAAAKAGTVVARASCTRPRAASAPPTPTVAVARGDEQAGAGTGGTAASARSTSASRRQPFARVDLGAGATTPAAPRAHASLLLLSPSPGAAPAHRADGGSGRAGPRDACDALGVSFVSSLSSPPSPAADAVRGGVEATTAAAWIAAASPPPRLALPARKATSKTVGRLVQAPAEPAQPPPPSPLLFSPLSRGLSQRREAAASSWPLPHKLQPDARFRQPQPPPTLPVEYPLPSPSRPMSLPPSPPPPSSLAPLPPPTSTPTPTLVHSERPLPPRLPLSHAAVAGNAAAGHGGGGGGVRSSATAVASRVLDAWRAEAEAEAEAAGAAPVASRPRDVATSPAPPAALAFPTLAGSVTTGVPRHADETPAAAALVRLAAVDARLSALQRLVTAGNDGDVVAGGADVSTPRFPPAPPLAEAPAVVRASAPPSTAGDDDVVWLASALNSSRGAGGGSWGWGGAYADRDGESVTVAAGRRVFHAHGTGGGASASAAAPHTSPPSGYASERSSVTASAARRVPRDRAIGRPSVASSGYGGGYSVTGTAVSGRLSRRGSAAAVWR